jgi:hypothetical protein
VKDSQRIIINKRLGPQEQIRILARILAGYPTEEQAMPPKIRQLIDEAWEELQPSLDDAVPEATPAAAPESRPGGGNG